MDFDSKTVSAHIETHPETTRDVLQRGRLTPKIMDENPGIVGTEDEPAGYFWLPTVLSFSRGTITWKATEETPERSIDVRALTLAEFLDLPGQLWDQWLTQAAEDNPHLFQPAPVDNKKK